MLQWHSVIFYNLTRAPFNLKLSPNCWQPSWAPVVQAELRRCRTSFLWHMERASRQCWLLCFVKVPGNDSARVSVLSRTSTAHLQPIISAAFRHLPGNKQVVCKVVGVGGLQTLNCSSPGFSYFWACVCLCVPAAEPGLYSVFSVFQELHNQMVGRTIAVCLDTCSSSEPMGHSRVLGLNTYSIKVWRDIRRNNDRVQQLNIRKILWKNSECGSYIHPC